MANNWTRGAAHRHTTAPISALGLHPVARELLLISRPAEGRRLSWPEHTVAESAALTLLPRKTLRICANLTTDPGRDAHPWLYVTVALKERSQAK